MLSKVTCSSEILPVHCLHIAVVGDVLLSVETVVQKEAMSYNGDLLH